jgi:hypothetical protein
MALEKGAWQRTRSLVPEDGAELHLSDLSSVISPLHPQSPHHLLLGNSPDVIGSAGNV